MGDVFLSDSSDTDITALQNGTASLWIKTVKITSLVPLKDVQTDLDSNLITTTNTLTNPMAVDLEMGSNKISGLGAPTLLQDAATKNYVDTTNTLQETYNNSTAPQIITNLTKGSISLQVGSALDTDNVLECKNIAGTKTFEVDGVGDIKCNNITTVSDKVHIGLNSGITTQGNNSVAIGVLSGNNNQGANSVALGNSSGQISQGDYSVAIGLFTGQNSLANGTVAIGSDSARNNSGVNSLYLGGRSGVNAGGFNNVIVLSAKDTACDPTQASQFIACSGVNMLTHDSDGLTTNNTTNSTSAITGSIHTNGGIGCGGDLFVGGSILGQSLPKASLNFGADITSGSNYYNVNSIASNATTSASIGPLNMGIIPYTGTATLLTFNKNNNSICDVNIFYDTGTISEVVRLPAGQWGTVVLAGNAVSAGTYMIIKPHSTPVNHTGDCVFKIMIT